MMAEFAAAADDVVYLMDEDEAPCAAAAWSVSLPSGVSGAAGAVGWTCQTCTFLNLSAVAPVCGMCNTRRETADRPNRKRKFSRALAEEGALDRDAELARQLHAQFNLPRTEFPCEACQRDFPIDELYSLDACSHRFCRTCLSLFIQTELQDKVAAEVGCKVCGTPLSIRDLQDFTRQEGDCSAEATARLGRVKGSAKSSRRLMKEFKALQTAKVHELGFSVAMLNENLYTWEVRIFGFDATDANEAALASDLRRVPGNAITLHAVFNSNYPMSPPYLRVVRPRFQYRTGHVTIGGSICTEYLTSKGWDPSMTVEAILVAVRHNMISGRARIDLATKQDYSAREAKEAFDRMRRLHNWY